MMILVLHKKHVAKTLGLNQVKQKQIPLNVFVDKLNSNITH